MFCALSPIHSSFMLPPQAHTLPHTHPHPNKTHKNDVELTFTSWSIESIGTSAATRFFMDFSTIVALLTTICKNKDILTMIDGVSDDVSARWSGHAMIMAIFIVLCGTCASTSWFVQGTCFWNSRTISYCIKKALDGAVLFIPVIRANHRPVSITLALG